jgi:hypothetical protein
MTEGFVRKRCPKCGGNVYLDRDYYGWYEKCFQCAYTRDLKNAIETQERVSEGNRKIASNNSSKTESAVEHESLYPS